MLIEFDQGDGREIINTKYIARLSERQRTHAIEVHLAYAPYELPHDFREGDPLVQVLNVIIIDVSYDHFLKALQSGADFYSLIDDG